MLTNQKTLKIIKLTTALLSQIKSSMTLNNAQNEIASISRLVPMITIATLLVNMFQPSLAIAQVAGTEVNLPLIETELKESPEGRLFNPAIQKPDRKVKSVITVYTSTPDQTDDSPFIAASGKHVYDGMIAANWLPFGTKIKIPALYGDKVFTVDDRMNKRYGFGRMDIWLDTSKKEARKFGVKRLEVEIYHVKKDLAKR